MSLNLSQIINPQSLSFSQIKEDILSYIKSRPDYEAWEDFYEGGAGTTQIELISGLAAYLAFHSIGARRETFIDQRRLYSSAINIASTLGYPVNRVSAPRYEISFTCNNSFYMDRNSPLATYKDFSLTPLQSMTINEGKNTVECVLGYWDSFSYTANNDANFQILQVLADNVDNDRNIEKFDSSTGRMIRRPHTIELFINGVQHEVVTYAEELLNDAILIKTYLDGVLLIFGDGTLGYKVRNNDEIVFNYIRATEPQDFITLDVGALDSIYNITFTNFVNVDPGSNMDSIEKLAVLPSGYFASKRRMLTGDDHIAILMSYCGDMISANYNKLEDTCCTVMLSYLFSDEHLITQYEHDDILAYLDDYKVVGVKLELENPEKYGIMFSLICVIDEGTDINELEQTFEQIIKKYTYQLGQTFHAGAVLAEFAKLTGIARVYANYPVSDKELLYNEYLKLIYYDITFTTNKSYSAYTDPENVGYFKEVDRGYVSSLSDHHLIANSEVYETHFLTSVTVGDYLVLPDGSKQDRAKVIEVVSDNELVIEEDLMAEADDKFEIYTAIEVEPPSVDAI